MDKKDNLGLEIKSIMEEETFDMTLSSIALDNILKNKKKTIKEKFNEFLNKEIEIPLAPAIIGFAALVVLTIVPKDVMKLQKERIVDINGSQVIIRESYEVSKKWK